MLRYQGRRIPRAAFLLTCILGAGCEAGAREILQSNQEIAVKRANEATIRLETPDPHFRLSPEERATVREGFDVDALERLLAAVEPDARPIILESFQQPPREELRRGEFTTPTMRMGDPELQPLLDEVWASAWERFAPHLLDSDDMDYPGKELAKRRRAQARRSGR